MSARLPALRRKYFFVMLVMLPAFLRFSCVLPSSSGYYLLFRWRTPGDAPAQTPRIAFPPPDWTSTPTPAPTSADAPAPASRDGSFPGWWTW